MARKKEAPAAVAGWFVTFADLMALLMCFFVILLAFSVQDQQKLKIVAGSMREAFGVQTQTRYSGVIEVPGLPTRSAPKHVEHVQPEESSPIADAETREREQGVRPVVDRAFALAAASLRQALQDLPEIAELSKSVVIEETEQGLNIEITDQDGRAMFPQGAVEPYERTQRLIRKLAGPVRDMPNRITIAGHTAASRQAPLPGRGPWELSADRANAVRRILEAEGVPVERVAMIAGRADTQPLFPEDPYIASNRRVTITLLHEAPPLPPGFRP